MSTTITPRLGSIVLYTLSESDAILIRQQRVNAGTSARAGNDALEGQTYPAMIVRDWAQPQPPDRRESYAVQLHERMAAELSAEQHEQYIDMKTSEAIGANASAEAHREALGAGVIAAFDRLVLSRRNEVSVNLQVFLDGNDTHWVTSRSMFDPEKHGRWVQVSHGNDLELPDSLQRDLQAKTSVHAGEADIQFRPDPRGHWQFPSEAYGRALDSAATATAD